MITQIDISVLHLQDSTSSTSCHTPRTYDIHHASVPGVRTSA